VYKFINKIQYYRVAIASSDTDRIFISLAYAGGLYPVVGFEF
jgi:hypothetical protein